MKRFIFYLDICFVAFLCGTLFAAGDSLISHIYPDEPIQVEYKIKTEVTKGDIG